MDEFQLDLGAVAGPRLAAAMAHRLRMGELSFRADFVPEGPYFVYEMGPDLFLGRHGRGPLRIAWDTNLLIDYFTYGRLLWEGDSLLARLPGPYGEELEGLQLLISLWALRDIRFYLLPRTLKDAKGKMTAQRMADRRRAFDEFSSALTLEGVALTV